MEEQVFHGQGAPVPAQTSVVVDELSDVSDARSEAALATLAAYTAHEVRNPLAALRAMAQLTLQSPESDVRRAMMQQIVAGIDELDQFLHQMLCFIQCESSCMQPVDIETVLSRVVQLFAVQADAADVDVQVRVPTSLPRVWGDPDLLRHVFINLLKNALEAMTDGGRIVIAVRRHLGCLRISFRDYGPGIPKELRERLLTDVAATSRPFGGGIGLPFVRKIVTDIHGGRLWFKTKTGVGTVFCVELPAVSFAGETASSSAERAV